MTSPAICPICNNTVTFKFLYLKEGIPVYCCSECGVGMAEPDQFNPYEYYDSSYFNGGRSDGYSDYVNTSSVLHAQFRKDIELLKKLGAHGGHLIELGCAYGYFLDIAMSASYQVSGLELCEDAVKSCNSRGYHDVHRGEISKENLSRFPAADAVIMLDVIEHLPNPASSLESVSKILKPGGQLLLTTGDFSSLIAKTTGSHWRLMTPPQHLWFFTPKSLKILCDRLGMDLIHIDHPWKTVPVGLILYQTLRYLTTPPTLPGWTHRIGIPINLFDAMRMVFRKRSTT